MSNDNQRPPLASHGNLEIYRGTYHSQYCIGPIKTHDGILVRFRKNQFSHIVQESQNRDGVKDTFSLPRAERLTWIKLALQDPELEFKAGWDKQTKSYDHSRRVTIMIDDFVVVIRLKSAIEADFVTCYVADSERTREKLKQAPTWQNPFL